VRISPTCVIGFEGFGLVVEICHVDISAQAAEVLLAVWSIPLLIRPVLTSVVPSKLTRLPFEPCFLIQKESTVTPTIEPDALVGVVQFEVCSPPPDYQVGSCPVLLSLQLVRREFFKCFIFIECFLNFVVIFVKAGVPLRWWVPGGSFPLHGLFTFAVWFGVEGVRAIVVFTDIVADNGRFLELCCAVLVAQIILVVVDTLVLLLI